MATITAQPSMDAEAVYESEIELAVHPMFALMVAGTIALYVKTRDSQAGFAKNKDFAQFQWQYIGVYMCVMFADWCQGPYLYRLFHHYGFLEEQIAALYITGMVSSILLGPTLGGMVDKYGRRFMSVVCCYLYCLSALLTLSENFYVLIFSRVLEGASSMLLFSAFESWMVVTHKQRSFPEEWVSRTFALSTVANGVSACLAGISSNVVVEINGHQPVQPFVLAAAFLLIGAFLVSTYWEVDEVDEDELLAGRGQCVKSLNPLVNDKKIYLLGALQALFEGAMYVFVFLWTPSLDPPHIKTHPPLGIIFGQFMLAIMIGSFLFRYLAQTRRVPVLTILGPAFLVACVCFTVAAATKNRFILLLLFIVFEGCCGIFFPGKTHGNVNEFKSLLHHASKLFPPSICHITKLPVQHSFPPSSPVSSLARCLRFISWKLTTVFARPEPSFPDAGCFLFF
eukprot:m.101465 g.101465  ORF g.101465 m.101465 type:complete len:454 (-) comp13199_c0_seq3:522-1883(-)